MHKANNSLINQTLFILLINFNITQKVHSLTDFLTQCENTLFIFKARWNIRHIADFLPISGGLIVRKYGT